MFLLILSGNLLHKLLHGYVPSYASMNVVGNFSAHCNSKLSYPPIPTEINLLVFLTMRSLIIYPPSCSLPILILFELTLYVVRAESKFIVSPSINY